MAKKLGKSQEQSEDVRVIAISKIWRITVGILAICIPLSLVTKSGATLPLAAIAGTTISTVAVWNYQKKKSQPNPLQQQQIQLLEERLANLEAIVSSNDFDLQMNIKKLELRESNKFPPLDNHVDN